MLDVIDFSWPQNVSNSLTSTFQAANNSESKHLTGLEAKARGHLDCNYKKNQHMRKKKLLRNALRLWQGTSSTVCVEFYLVGISHSLSVPALSWSGLRRFNIHLWSWWKWGTPWSAHESVPKTYNMTKSTQTNNNPQWTKLCVFLNCNWEPSCVQYISSLCVLTDITVG